MQTPPLLHVMPSETDGRVGEWLCEEVQHLHIIATNGYFYGNESFIKGPTPSPHELEDAFRHKIFNLLKKEGMITDFVIKNMMGQYDDLAPQRI